MSHQDAYGGLFVYIPLSRHVGLFDMSTIATNLIDINWGELLSSANLGLPVHKCLQMPSQPV